ncbi:putative reverse transcriptase domain-containing protein [Tanacetum coccineum]
MFLRLTIFPESDSLFDFNDSRFYDQSTKMDYDMYLSFLTKYILFALMLNTVFGNKRFGAFRSDKRQVVSISNEKLVWQHLNNERQLPIGVKVFSFTNLIGKSSYANVIGKPSGKKLNFHTLFTPGGNGIDVVVPVESIRTISEQFSNTAYGFFLGKRVAYPVVVNYIRNTWGKYGMVRSMFSSSTGLFSFQFSSMDGLDAMLENGPWFIHNNPLILRKWHPDENLLKEDVSTILVWVKLHGVLVTAFSEDGLSAIATKLGTPLMLDSYTADMCMQSWGRSSYARAMIELRADVELKDNIVAAMPKITGEGYYTCNIRVEYKFVDDDGNPLVPTVVDSDSEVEVVYDETANLRILTSGKEGSDKGYGTNSLLEQWRDSYPDNDDYNPYDDNMYENHDMSEHLQSICDDLDITVRGKKKK